MNNRAIVQFPVECDLGGCLESALRDYQEGKRGALSAMDNIARLLELRLEGTSKDERLAIIREVLRKLVIAEKEFMQNV